MSRGACPSRSQERALIAFEVQIEDVWGRLGWRGKTVCLSPVTGLLVTYRPSEKVRDGEIGTFTREIGLADFRAECFHAYGQNRGGRA